MSLIRHLRCINTHYFPDIYRRKAGIISYLYRYSMRKCLFLLCFLPLFANGQSSFNMTLLANEVIPNLPVRSGAKYNDVWGFKHPTNGTEVAIIGGIEAIFFYNVTSPANPVLIHTHPVTNLNGTTNGSLWRDFKTYQNYAYASADEGDSGLIVFDLSQVPTTVTKVYQSNQFWNRSHNIYIDTEHARLYAAGPNTQSSGIIILNLQTPAAPTLLRSLSLTSIGGGYVHDIHVRDTIAYCSHGSLHKLSMYSVNNVNNIFPIASIENYQEAGYNHSSWVNEDATFLVMVDETHGSDVKLVDIDTMEDISTDDITTFYSELLGASAPGSSIVHNPFILGDLVYLAYYHDGVQVYDISDPTNIERIAYLDTYPDNTDYFGYEGCWGVYPYLPSGIILASDQTYGLYVLELTQQSLDIDFLSFEAVRKDEDVQLNWSVADASFGNKFEIYRSADGGKSFQPIGKVKLEESEINYSFLDENVLPRQRYLYRIDFIELDGKHIASPIRTIIPSNTSSTIKVVNPATHALIVDILKPIENAEFRIFNLEGKEVWSKVMAEPKARIELNISTLIPGQYVLTTTWLGGAENMMIQKW